MQGGSELVMWWLPLSFAKQLPQLRLLHLADALGEGHRESDPHVAAARLQAGRAHAPLMAHQLACPRPSGWDTTVFGKPTRCRVCRHARAC